MIAQRRVDRNLFLAPDAGLRVPNLPVIHVVTVVDDVAAERDECGVDLSDCLHQCLTYGRVRRFGVLGIMEAGISVGGETERSAYLQLQGNRLGLWGLHLRVGPRAGSK